MFSLGTVRHLGRVKTVLATAERLIDLSGTVLREHSTLALLEHWEEAVPLLEQIAAARDQDELEGEIEWLPPIVEPRHVFCAGANYGSHATEIPPDGGSGELGGKPFFFLKAPGSLIGHGQPIRIPAFTERADWECELAVVIGRTTRNVSTAEALACVAGFAVFNDITARDHVRRAHARFPHDWVAGKCIDTFGPFGPGVVPAKFVPDWRSLRLRLWVNGVLKQDARAGEMTYGVPEQIAFLSQYMTLRPGDVIATGTPGGVGEARKEYLRPGDIVEAEVEGIGRLKNPCVEDSMGAA